MVLRSIFGQNKDEVWKQLSEEIGGKFIEAEDTKGSKVVAKTGEWTVTLDIHLIESKYDRIYCTRMRAPYVNKDGFRFSITRGGFFSNLGKLLGMQDIEVGFPEFDKEFIIKGNDENKVKSLFANQKIRDLLLSLPSTYFEVKDDEGWFREEFPEGVDELYFMVDEMITDLDRLKQLYELFAETLNHLTHIGSAYEDDPNIEL